MSWQTVSSFRRDPSAVKGKKLERGLLRRNDYTAEVFGSWAKATHYCWDHESFDGLVVPTRRKALLKRPNGKPIPRPAVVSR